MDYLFQIIFILYNCLRLVLSDVWLRTYFVIDYLFQILMNSNQTVTYCDIIHWNLLYVVCLVCVCVKKIGLGQIWISQEVGNSYRGMGYFVSLEQGYTFPIEYWNIKGPSVPFVLHVLYSVRAPFTIHVLMNLLGSCLPMDCLFQITFMDYLF